MVILRKEEYKFEPIPNGSYVAEVESIEEKENKRPDWGPLLRVKFRIIEEPYVNRRVSGLVPGIWKPKNKLDKWLSAMGVDASASTGKEVSEEQLKGARVSVYVVTDENSTFANVKEVNVLSQRDLNKVSANADKPQFRPAPAKTVQVATTNAVTPQPIQGVTQPAVVTPATVSVSPVASPLTAKPAVRKADIPF